MITRITPDTRLPDLLAAHPALLEELPKIHGKFKLLHTPLGKVMMGQATIAEMSRRSGMDLATLMREIEKRIEL